jgi:hypothetical protein
MKKESDDEFLDEDIFIYAKAKMKHICVINSTKVEVKQFSNNPHKNKDDSVRINVPDELKDGESYKDATIGTVKSISLTELWFTIYE